MPPCGDLFVKETAAVLRAHPNTIRRYMETGYLEWYRVGRSIRIRRESVLRILEAR